MQRSYLDGICGSTKLHNSVIQIQLECGRLLERHEQSKDNGPDIEGHQGRKPWVPSNKQNGGNKDPTPRLTFPPLAHHWSCSLDLLTLHITSHWFGPSPGLSFPGMPLVMWQTPSEKEPGAENSPTQLPPELLHNFSLKS